MESFEKGTKRREGVINIIDLHGTWREMGRQYGALMASEMKHIYEKGVIEKLVNEHGLDIENLKDRASKFYANYPFRFKEILCGMSETSGLSMEQRDPIAVEWSKTVSIIEANPAPAQKA